MFYQERGFDVLLHLQHIPCPLISCGYDGFGIFAKA